jgi:hypothetical protein
LTDVFELLPWALRLRLVGIAVKQDPSKPDGEAITTPAEKKIEAIGRTKENDLLLRLISICP